MKFANANKLDRKSGGSPHQSFDVHIEVPLPLEGKHSKKPFSTHVRWCERGAPVQVTHGCLDTPTSFEEMVHYLQLRWFGLGHGVHADCFSSLARSRSAR